MSKMGEIYEELRVNNNLDEADSYYEEDIMTPKEVAGYLRFSYRNTMDLIHEGVIPAYKIGGNYRIRKHDLFETMESLRVGK